MQNLFTVMLILIGAAVAVFVALIVLQTGTNSSSGPPETPTQTLIPQEIEGFVIERMDRADPIFEGELFSVHASLVPEAGSPFEGSVESLGITVFLLENLRAANEIKPLLLLGDASPLTIEGVPMQAFVNEDAQLAGLLWQNNLQIYYVLVSGVADSQDLNMDVLTEAAQFVARAIVKGEE